MTCVCVAFSWQQLLVTSLICVCSTQLLAATSDVMKLTVRLCGQWLCVPCTGTETVGWLAAAALARQDTLSAAGHGPGHQLHQHKPGESHRVRQVRRARCPGAVSLEDKIKDVFDDHDFAVIMMDDESYADGTSEFPFIVDCAYP